MSLTIFRIISIFATTTICAVCTATAAPPLQKSQNRVLVIGTDGTRPDAIEQAKTPNLHDLMQHGSFTNHAQILGARYRANDTASGPGWTSILTGVWADKHGVQDNSFKGSTIEAFPHFFKRLKEVRPDAQTISLVAWEPIDQFIVSEADERKIEVLPPGSKPTIDLKVSADQLGIEVADGKWHHLLAKRTGKQIQIFLDGKLAGEKKDAAGAFDLGGDSYFIGRDTRGGKLAFHGQLDDCRIWNRALDTKEIEQLPQSAGDDASSAARQGLLFEADGKEPGQSVSLTPELRAATQGDFTIECRFQTTESKRSILLGNYSGKTSSLNLELGEKNTVRLWVQPPPGVGESFTERENIRDAAMAANAARILTEEDPTAMFIYFHQGDATGHGIGFGPSVPEYMNAIENIDQHIGTVLKSLRARPAYEQENWLVIVCTDHGGKGQSHGKGHDVPEIHNVFLIVSGEPARVGTFEEPVYLVDVAATALAHLTGSIKKEWQLDGRAVGLKASH